MWFFNDIHAAEVSNFVGRVGAFVAVISFQLLGYTAYFMPIAVGFVGWHQFWCQEIDARYTKIVGAVLLVACAGGLTSLAFGAFDTTARPFRPGGLVGEGIARLFAHFLNRTGAAIVLLTLLRWRSSSSPLLVRACVRALGRMRGTRGS